MISYAQNFEDVLLNRAFRGKTDGFYVDVGAHHPVTASVTKHFYDKGWRGLNLEPGPTFPTLANERPRDVNLKLAVSGHDGELGFFEHPEDPGTSTTRPELHPNLVSRVHERRLRVVPCRTLASILSEHAPGVPIDFMNIDVEGSEEAVIRGADWVRFRPRIVLIEAVAPYASTPTHQGWEPVLTASGYQFAYFDGINRFYIAEEHSDLHEHFRVPVNVLDGFQQAR
jgi:FkbM family methyltransferase